MEGELPTNEQLGRFEDDVRRHTYVHTNVQKFLEGFRYDAHPMGMLLGAIGALSTFYPDAKHIADGESRYLQRIRLLAKMPTIAAFAFRHSRGLPYVLPRNDLDYIPNFVNMTFEIGGRHEPSPVLEHALEILLVLHADHEQNCSTSAVRSVGSSQVDPFSAVSAGIAACTARSTEAPTRPSSGCSTRSETRSVSRNSSRRSRPARTAMGFGHRVYKSYDPREADQAGRGRRVRADRAQSRSSRSRELERIALETSTSSPASSTRTSTSTRG